MDRGAPSSVDPQSIGSSVFPNRVDLQWQGAADDLNGVGVWFYWVYRDGAYIGSPLTGNVQLHGFRTDDR